MNDRPALISPAVDKALGFAAGFFGSLLVGLGLIVAMFYWAGQAAGSDAAARRAHAVSVTKWTIGGLVASVLLVLAFVALMFSASAAMVGTMGQIQANLVTDLSDLQPLP